MHILNGMVRNLTSVIIPSRNEKYLQKTIVDLLSTHTQDIEVIAVLDGYWPTKEELVEDRRVHYIHFSDARGMRNAINAGVSLSQGEYILKTDAHCKFSQAFDEILKKDCDDTTVVVPRRYPLDPVNWVVINNPKYPIDYMYLDNNFTGQVWHEKNKDNNLSTKRIDDLMSAQGSCWFMKKSYYEFLELMDEENYGTFAKEFQEIGLKAWLSGGRVVVNKDVTYAHWHKEETRGYSLSKEESQKAESYVQRWKDTVWHKQTKPLSWLFEKFAPVPTNI